MALGANPKKCLTYVPVLHDGVGWVQICVSMLENFPNEVLSPTLVLPRAFRAISPTVDVREAIPRPLPYRYALPLVHQAVNFRFRRAISAAEPQNTIAYFWPGAPTKLVRYARAHGLLTVREMINTHTATAKRILDDAYARLGLPPDHKITDAIVARESEELKLYDYIFAPSPRVASSLIDAGISSTRILRSSYGWSPSSFVSTALDTTHAEFRALFIATICVRKGVPQLLAAWEKSGVKGELVLVGNIEPALKPLLAPYADNSNVRFVDYSLDLGRFYKSADIFILPSLEEGDPLVTYEAAGCGLPVITTPMGSANIIKDGVNGFVVDPYDIDGFARAISTLANSAELRGRFAAQAAHDALNYSIEKVSRRRVEILLDALGKRSLGAAL
jgi:glycosyltransferase involved in cell wall biosynthesis